MNNKPFSNSTILIIFKAFAWHLEYNKCYNYFALTAWPDGLILRKVTELSSAFLKQLFAWIQVCITGVKI